MPKCYHPGCAKRAAYGVQLGKPEMCRDHKSVDMIHLLHQMCAEPGCTGYAILNYPGEKPKYCVNHHLPNMVNVMRRRCEATGCSKLPIYNFPDLDKGRYCAAHKLEGMISFYSISRKCAEPSCEKLSSCGYGHDKVRLYCGKHKKAGMIHLHGQMCIAEGCATGAMYNFPDQRKRLYCSKHKSPGMIQMVFTSRRVASESSPETLDLTSDDESDYTSPSEYDGTPAADCGHLDEPDEDEPDKPLRYCKAFGCYQSAIADGELCDNHQNRTATTRYSSIGITIKQTSCNVSGCTRKPKYGYPFCEATRCFVHRLPKQLRKRDLTCEECQQKATHATKSLSGFYCEQHRGNGSTELVDFRTICAKCHQPVQAESGGVPVICKDCKGGQELAAPQTDPSLWAVDILDELILSKTRDWHRCVVKCERDICIGNMNVRQNRRSARYLQLETESKALHVVIESSETRGAKLEERFRMSYMAKHLQKRESKELVIFIKVKAKRFRTLSKAAAYALGLDRYIEQEFTQPNTASASKDYELVWMFHEEGPEVGDT